MSDLSDGMSYIDNNNNEYFGGSFPMADNSFWLQPGSSSFSNEQMGHDAELYDQAELCDGDFGLDPEAPGMPLLAPEQRATASRDQTATASHDRRKAETKVKPREGTTFDHDGEEPYIQLVVSVPRCATLGPFAYNYAIE